MCDYACIDFGKRVLRQEDISGKRVIEVGSFNVNGSLRAVIQRFQPAEYIGVDIVAGPGVDQICASEKLIKRFGSQSFDVVVSTEMVEHVRDWKKVVHNLKTVLRPGGLLLISTRSEGFPYHGYPSDFWRYEGRDMEFIFSDFEIKVLEVDPEEPGVFLLARKPRDFFEKNTGEYMLYSMILDRRASVAVATICLPLKMLGRIFFHIKQGDILSKISERFKRPS